MTDSVQPVELERVRPRVRPGWLVEPAPAGGIPRHEELDSAAARRPQPQISPRALAEALAPEALSAAAFLSLLLATREAALAAIGGGAVLGLHRLRGAVARLPFSFGDGFLGFRSDTGWPQGVQEDDDFHWSWSPGRDEDAEAGGRGRERPVRLGSRTGTPATH